MLVIDRSDLSSDRSERLRTFVARRAWLHGGHSGLITSEQWASLKARDGEFWNGLSEAEQNYLLGFMDGWLRSRE